MYSFLIDYSIQANTPIVEPVTVAEAKQYCRVTNTVEDDLFVQLIAQSREAVEKAAQISIVPKQVEAWFTNLGSSFYLPYGPVTYILGIYDEGGTLIPSSSYRIVGSQYPKINFPNYADMRIVYNVGYDCVPDELKIAILDQINYGYENRGMDVNDMGICEKTWRVCQRWTRTSPIL